MKGYKAFNKVGGQDKVGECKDMLYEEGQEYKLKGELKMCCNGFHFCKDLLVTILYYDMDNATTVYAEVEALGGVVKGADNTKYATDHIKVVRFISEEEVKDVAESSVDKLVDEEDWCVRIAVVKQGYGLERLVNDERWRVRLTVAKQGYGLEKLVDDEDWCVRREVARQGYGLEKLVDDEDGCVREAVAEQGYGLDKLINDKDWRVRESVAKQGYGLGKLVNDEHWLVRDVAKEMLERSRTT